MARLERRLARVELGYSAVLVGPAVGVLGFIAAILVELIWHVEIDDWSIALWTLVLWSVADPFDWYVRRVKRQRDLLRGH